MQKLIKLEINLLFLEEGESDQLVLDEVNTEAARELLVDTVRQLGEHTTASRVSGAASLITQEQYGYSICTASYQNGKLKSEVTKEAVEDFKK